MQKLSRNILKEIVKECIVEIFEESFFGGPGELMNENVQHYQSDRNQTSARRTSRRPQRSNQQNISRRKGLDNISYASEEKSRPVQNEAFNRKINNITSNMTSDPVMTDIFKDTAATTLQSQIGAETNKGMHVLAGGDSAAKQAYHSDPTELFAESASKWASLAFADPIKK
tara:strand:+ start:8928 stop:9440 length:513 start_codon:yes stop_codon:yes gene_type:complete